MWLYTKAIVGETCSISKSLGGFLLVHNTKRFPSTWLLLLSPCPKLEYPCPPRWFIEYLFYYIKHKSFLIFIKSQHVSLLKICSMAKHFTTTLFSLRNVYRYPIR